MRILHPGMLEEVSSRREHRGIFGRSAGKDRFTHKRSKSDRKTFDGDVDITSFPFSLHHFAARGSEKSARTLKCANPLPTVSSARRPIHGVRCQKPHRGNPAQPYECSLPRACPWTSKTSPTKNKPENLFGGVGAKPPPKRPAGNRRPLLRRQPQRAPTHLGDSACSSWLNGRTSSPVHRSNLFEYPESVSVEVWYSRRRLRPRETWSMVEQDGNTLPAEREARVWLERHLARHEHSVRRSALRLLPMPPSMD